MTTMTGQFTQPNTLNSPTQDISVFKEFDLLSNDKPSVGATIDYRKIMNPRGIEMYNNQRLKKETDKELTQMRNRIKLLQFQDGKIKKRNVT